MWNEGFSQHCDPEKRFAHLNSALWFLPSPLPALCAFQVPVRLELWESRCLAIAYLEIPSTQPLGWNPLASVRKRIAFLRGRLCLLAEGGYKITRAIRRYKVPARRRNDLSHWPDVSLCQCSACCICLCVTIYWEFLYSPPHFFF